MLPGGMSPRQMQKLMAQMGIKTSEIRAKEVIIKKEDGELVIHEPQVIMMDVKGQKSFQIMGRVEDRRIPSFTEEDLKMVMEKGGCSREEAERMLSETEGDIAEAILKLQSQKNQ